MYLIEEQDFQRQYSLPTNQGRTEDGTDSQATAFIDGFVPLFLKDALGYTLFKDFDSNVTNGVLESGAPQIWLDLLNGKEYTKDSVLKKWNGLISTNGAFKESILITFVYYHWLENELSQMTSTGEKRVKSKNAVNVNSTQRLVTTWNTFVSQNQHKCNTNYATHSVVNGIPFTDWYGNSTDTYVSLIEFLQDNETDYPDANLKTYNVKNQFGL